MGHHAHHSTKLLDTHPSLLEVDRGTLDEAVGALLDCAQTCTGCADACLAEENVAELRRCIVTDQNCADICTQTARTIGRHTAADPAVWRAALEACISACGSCADECDKHASMHEHCAVCRDACRACEEACNKLIAALPA